MNEFSESNAEIKARAAKYAADGKYRKAIDEYRKILEMHPGDPDILNLTGDIYRRLGQRANAVEMFEKAVEVYAEQAYYDNAIAISKKILRMDPDRSEIMKKLAELYAEQGLTGQATSFLVDYAVRKKEEGNAEAMLDAYRSLIAIRPKDIGLRMKLADEYIGQGELGDACTQLQEISVLYREAGKFEEVVSIEKLVREITAPGEEWMVEDYTQRAKEAEESGAIDEAIVYYYQAAEQFSEQATYHLARDAYLKITRLRPEELKPWQKLVQMTNVLNDRKATTEAYLGLAKALVRKNAVDSAASVYKKILLSEPDNEEAKNALASIGEEEPTQAEVPGVQRAPTGETAEEAVEQAAGQTAESTGPPAIHEAGPPSVDGTVSHAPERTVEKTIDKPVFKVADETTPEQPISLDELIAEFKRGVEEHIDKDDYSTYYDLGVSFKEMGRLDEAINHLKKAAEGNKERPKAYELLGRCYVEKRDFDAAVNYFKKGLSFDGFSQNEYLGLRYNLALAYEATDRGDEALREYKTIESEAPQYFDVPERIRKIESTTSVGERLETEKSGENQEDDKIPHV